MFDYARAQYVFPPEIVDTVRRPDILIWSTTSKIAILVELTCPAEEGILKARKRKNERYEKLITSIKCTWGMCRLFTIEVGARGFVSHTVRKFLRCVGFSYAHTTRICKQLSAISARCSHIIWLSRDSKHWDRKRDILTPRPDSLVETKPDDLMSQRNESKHMDRTTTTTSLSNVTSTTISIAGTQTKTTTSTTMNLVTSTCEAKQIKMNEKKEEDDNANDIMNVRLEEKKQGDKDGMEMSDFDDNDLKDILENVTFDNPGKSGVPVGYGIVQDIDIEESKRGFNSDEEALVDDLDWS